MEKDIGCILRLYPLGEYGLIVCWSTQQHGLIRTVARQARKAGSDFFGRIDLFHECELLYRPVENVGLSTLSSVALLNPRLPLRADLNKLRLAGYMAQLLTATVEEGTGESCWHTLISQALDYVASSEPRAAILHRFEQRMAELHGLYTPQQEPHAALAHHFSKLPGGRTELLQHLRAR